MKHAFLIAVAAICLAAPAAAQTGPSFDCNRAQGPVEQAICFDPDLSLLDREIAALYQAAQSGPDMDATRQSELTARQQGWIASRDSCISAPELTACVTAIYGQRILELKTYYAGATGDAGPTSYGPVLYTCDAPVYGLSAVFINGPGTRWAVVSWEDNAVTLVGTVSDEGEAFAPSVFGDPFRFWISHDEALLTIPGQPEVACIQPQG